MKDRTNKFAEEIESAFVGCADFVKRKINLQKGTAYVYSLREMASKDYISEKIIRPIIKDGLVGFKGDFSRVLQVNGITENITTAEAIDAIADGNAAVVAEIDAVYTAKCPCDSYFGRSTGKSDTDVTVAGSQIGFVEDADKNVSLVRRYIKNPSLKCKEFRIGSVTETKVVLLYIEGRADGRIVKEIGAKIKEAEKSTTVITDSANIGALIRKNRYGFFPSFGYTEKTDKAVSLLVSGRCVIICNGSPFVLTAPYIFIESLQSAEDYLRTPYYATFSRILRFISLITAVYLPAIFIVFAERENGLLPGKILDIIEKERSEIPFDLSAEILIMLAVFEMLREVGIRMPQPIGNAVGLVGSIIIGDSATEAGIASTTVILVVAISAVANFVVPVFMNTTVIIRFALVTAAAAAGAYGIACVTALTVFALCEKEEFGVPFMCGISPFDKNAFSDFLVSVPQKNLGKRELYGGDR